MLRIGILRGGENSYGGKLAICELFLTMTANSDDDEGSNPAEETSRCPFHVAFGN